MSADPKASELQSKALTVARIYFQSHLNSPEAKAYLAKRELTPATCRKFEIGYAPDNWRGLVEHFKSHPVRLAAKDAGLITSPANSQRLLDFFRDRLTFPIRTATGELVGYGGRLVGEHPNSPKYMNTPETDLFQKSKLLYGLHEHLSSIEERREAILVEGYMDVVRLSVSGFDYAVAPMGTALTTDQIHLLLERGVRRLWICLDGDNAGEAAAQRSVDLLMDHYHPALQIMLVQMPDKHDPDSLIREHGPEGFGRSLESAVSLPAYIHAVCTKGFPTAPCLEDKALYLQRLGPYIQRAAGFLQDKLIEQAQDFTGLTPDQIYADRQSRLDNSSVAQWHSLVSLAARWMVFDQNSTRIAERISKITATRNGVDELAALGKAISEGTSPSGLLNDFCMAHGQLQPEEMQVLRREWSSWLQDVQLEQHLESLRQMPFDQHAKNSIRAITAAMRPG
ncbi:DNA primase [Stutzerimonas stutzeri]|uniref:DNA primase n=1 Tax=Stutzerimonas stutzeri TaxID=316 RepID=UPI0015E3A29C|nr:toprim domain-containing protein [Stutzerimonas stutzeri]MBA1280414.1 toprim domain-containing protein [Stutzerimonas stutzeri]